MSEFDEAITEHAQAMNQGKINVLEDLLAEIKIHDYVTAHEVKGAILNRLEVLKN